MGVNNEIDMRQFLLDLCTTDPGGEFRTSGEWSEFFGVGLDKTKKILQRAKAAGLLNYNWVYREAIDGRRLRVPVYSLNMEK